MVSSDLKIYRFISFFDLYKIMTEKKLRFKKLAKMTDKNEGLGEVLSLHEDLQLVGYVSDEQNIIKEHNLIKESDFISCWTKSCDSIALWSLYSEDNSGIRIKTSLIKLHDSIRSFSNNTCAWDFLPEISSGNFVTRGTKLNEVKYVNFFNIKEMIRERFLEFKSNSIKDFEEFKKNRIIGDDGWRFKDEAYSHEQEIRALISLRIRNSVTRVEWYESMMRKLPYDDPTPGTLPDDIYIDVGDNFLEEICFDPRCPTFKREVFEKVIGSYKVNIVESNAFGYAPDIESFALKTG